MQRAGPYSHSLLQDVVEILTGRDGDNQSVEIANLDQVRERANLSRTLNYSITSSIMRDNLTLALEVP